ncbi:MAG: hypothetical protein ACXWHC_18810 [Usitatibacter sp.]
MSRREALLLRHHPDRSLSQLGASVTPINLTLPNEARIALSWAKTRYPDAFIAGGYLRDLALDRKPKDLDIFTWEVEIKGEGKSMIDHDGVDHDEWVALYEGSRITDAEVPVTLDGVSLPVQIVHLNRAVADNCQLVASQFMVGLSQLWSNGDRVWGTDAFFRDRADETFTVTRCEGHPEMQRILRKVASFNERYPTFGIVIPPEFVHHLQREAA